MKSSLDCRPWWHGKRLPQHYDPAYSGGNLDRPALQRLLKDVDAGRIDVTVVYKIDRLTPSLANFAKLVEAFDAQSISFVAGPSLKGAVLGTCPRQDRGFQT